MADLEENDELQDGMLSVYHAVNHTLAGTAAYKIIENHHGRAFIQQKAVQQIVLQPAGAPAPAGALPGGPAAPAALPGPNRAERRRQERDARKRGGR